MLDPRPSSAMISAAESGRSPGPFRRLRGWWRERSRLRRMFADLARCDPLEVERMAHDVGVSGAELRSLAGKWPDASDLLSRRLDELRLDAAELARARPLVLRDLEKTCSLCVHQRRCRHDLDRNPADPGWQDYCPNATTLAALQ